MEQNFYDIICQVNGNLVVDSEIGIGPNVISLHKQMLTRDCHR